MYKSGTLHGPKFRRMYVENTAGFAAQNAKIYARFQARSPPALLATLSCAIEVTQNEPKASFVGRLGSRSLAPRSRCSESVDYGSLVLVAAVDQSLSVRM
jgi:hypothetical protein